MILALEMSMSHPSVALMSKEGVLQHEVFGAKPMEHVSQINVLIDEILRTTSIKWEMLQGVSFNEGPGSYTGLRVAAAAAKALCYAHQLAYIPISAHDILASLSAELWPDSKSIAYLISARKGVAFVRLHGSDQESISKIRRMTADEWNFLPDTTLVYHGDELHKFVHENNLSRAHRIDISAASQAISISRLVSIAYDLQAISTHRPLYVLPPNITQRKKPLIS